MGLTQSQYILESGHRLLWYRIDRALSHGAYGITYLAEDINLQRPVAIKEFFPTQYCARATDSASIMPVSDDAEEHFNWAMNRFLSEARTLAQFEHPNIIRVLNVFEDNGTAYMVMHYEHGTTLSELLKKRHTLNEQELTRISKPLMDGLEKVHASGFVHRDIKPSNIYIRDDETPVLLDFGSARQSIKEHTQDLNKLLSPGYAPIEQYASNSGSQGPWSDIYSLGATLYRAVTGQAPPSAIERSEALISGRQDIVPAGELVSGTYSQYTLAAIDHALAFRSKDRPPDIATWRKEFDYTNDATAKSDTAPAPEKNAAAKAAPVPPVGNLEDWLVDASSPGMYRQALMRSHATKSNKGTRSTDGLPTISPWESHTESVWHAAARQRHRGILDYLRMGGGVPIVAIGALAVVLLFIMTTDPVQQTAPNEASQADAEMEAEVDNTETVAEINHAANSAGSDGTATESEPLTRFEEPDDQAQQTMALNSREPDDIRSEPGAESALSTNNPAAETAPTPESESPESGSVEHQQAEIESTLEAARADIAARRLTTPEGNNAYDKYRSVLEKDPDNEAVHEGFREIVGVYVQIANNAISKGDFSHADRMLQRAEQVDPQSIRLLETQDKLEAQREASDSDSESSTVQREEAPAASTPVGNEASSGPTDPSPPLPSSNEASRPPVRTSPPLSPGNEERGAPVVDPSPPIHPADNDANRSRKVSSPLPSYSELARDPGGPSSPLTN